MTFLRGIPASLRGLGACAARRVRRCPQCGGKMEVEHFHPPIFVKDGASGVRARCTVCGHVEVLFCRMGP